MNEWEKFKTERRQKNNYAVILLLIYNGCGTTLYHNKHWNSSPPEDVEENT